MFIGCGFRNYKLSLPTSERSRILHSASEMFIGCGFRNYKRLAPDGAKDGRSFTPLGVKCL